ncbi:uncharacterized protein B0H64DRAFT_379413 [Chaetomium fimeti]|uniref:Uncharacterized protein n=1 Tax=Chaetomium fimeti TaxID=1854472 RepID=A0AAE0HNN3_9PEZI|nr:hypothetical protein B0H64DRAFT_379413 [Chaetomium fimeti]
MANSTQSTMDLPEVKQEPGESRVPLALPEVKREPDNAQVLLGSGKVKLEPQESKGRNVNQPTVEPGEIPSIATVFPRALYETPSANRPDTSHHQSTEPKGSGAPRSWAASAHNQGSPLRRAKELFEQAQLRLRRERNARAGPSAPNGAAAGQTSASSGHRGTGNPGLSAITNSQASVNTSAPALNGTVQSGHYPSVLGRLSRECQMRHFNLEWQLQTLQGGKFTCHVKLRDLIVRGDKQYDCEQLAKEAVAHKAIAVVQAWPIDHFPSASSRAHRRAPGQMEGRWGSRNGPTTKQEGSSLMEALGHGRAMALTAMGPGDRWTEQQAALLDHMSRVMGISVPVSSRKNPEATQAFLDGVAVGTRLAGAGISGFSMRNRSRSPSIFRASSPIPSRACSPPPRDNRRLNSSPPNRRPPLSSPRLPVRRRGRLSPPSVHDRWVHDRYRDDRRPSHN